MTNKTNTISRKQMWWLMCSAGRLNIDWMLWLLSKGAYEGAWNHGCSVSSPWANKCTTISINLPTFPGGWDSSKLENQPWTSKDQAKPWQGEVTWISHTWRWIPAISNRLCLPNNVKIRRRILEEAHNSLYSVHTSGTKMYKDLR